MAEDRNLNKPVRDGLSVLQPSDISGVDRGVASSDREYRESLGEFRRTIRADWFSAYANGRVTHWRLPTNIDSTICKTNLDFAPNADKSNSPHGLLASSERPFAANSVLETFQHLPKDLPYLSEDTVSDVVAVRVSICKQSLGGYVSALTWRFAGTTQFDGALVIKKSSAHSRSYILLASLALENVLKGLIIVSDAKLISSGRLDKTLQSHKLLDLAKRVDGLVLSKDERHILHVCQDAIPYWGRYPIPLEYKGLKPKEAADDKFHTCFRKLHFRLCKSLYEKLKDGWDSGVGSKTLQMRSIRYGDAIYLKEKLPWIKDDEV